MREGGEGGKIGTVIGGGYICTKAARIYWSIIGEQSWPGISTLSCST